MAEFTFTPIPTEEMKKFATDLGLPPANNLMNSFVSGRMKGISRFFGGCLTRVSSQDVLYVVCHGKGKGSMSTGAERGGVHKVYSPDELASVMQKEGLTKSIVNVRLLICGSALSSGLEKGVPPFGKRLSDAMKAIGYSNVKVRGYNGLVNTEDGKVLVYLHLSDNSGYKDGNEPRAYKDFV